MSCLTKHFVEHTGTPHISSLDVNSEAGGPVFSVKGCQQKRGSEVKLSSSTLACVCEALEGREGAGRQAHSKVHLGLPCATLTHPLHIPSISEAATPRAKCLLIDNGTQAVDRLLGFFPY